MTTCRDCGKQFRLGPLVDLPQPTRCMECLIGLEAEVITAEARIRDLEALAADLFANASLFNRDTDALWRPLRDRARAALAPPPADGGGGE